MVAWPDDQRRRPSGRRSGRARRRRRARASSSHSSAWRPRRAARRRSRSAASGSGASPGRRARRAGAARSGRWAWAGALGGLAALTRNSGVLLLVPLVLLFLYGRGTQRDRRRAPRWRRATACAAALWLALVPLGLALYLAWRAIALGDAFAPFHAQALWLRHFEPLGAAVGGVRRGVATGCASSCTARATPRVLRRRRRRPVPGRRRTT